MTAPCRERAGEPTAGYKLCRNRVRGCEWWTDFRDMAEESMAEERRTTHERVCAHRLYRSIGVLPW